MYKVALDVCSACKIPRISPTFSAIQELGWLRISNRIDHKILCLIHKCVLGSSPCYLKQLRSFPSIFVFCFSLPSFAYGTLSLHCSISSSSFVRRSFLFYDPKLWNSLPPQIRNERRHHIFKKLVKAYFLKSPSLT